MSAPVVVDLQEGSPADLAGLAVGDSVVALNGQQPRDVIEWQRIVDEPDLELEIDRGGLMMTIEVEKRAGQPLGIDVDAAIFDRVRTCDNHCDFCFIYQLPKGMRRSLYLKDDDYRLSFLYGNFTTLTRFTEADLERVITERLSPLYVSIHATDPDVRTHMLRNKRGAMSLRWLDAMLEAGIEVHGQVVCCPDVNNGTVLEQTLAGVLDRYEKLASIAVVPLGVSRFSPVDEMRPHTVAEAREVVEIVERWQGIFSEVLGRRMVFAADEYYLRAELAFPAFDSYEDVDMHEDGIGMATTFAREFQGEADEATNTASGFFAWVEGAPAEGYRAPRASDSHETTPVDDGDGVPTPTAATPTAATPTAVTQTPVTQTPVTQTPVTQTPVTLQSRPRKDRAIAVLTGTLGAHVIEPLIAASQPQAPTRVIAVTNDFFGGNVGVTGLMVGEDLQRVLAAEPEGDRYLLPDVCLSNGRFLDGLTVDDLPRTVEVIATNGISLRKAIGA